MVNRWNVYCVVHAYTKPDDEYVWIIVRNQQDLPKPSKYDLSQLVYGLFIKVMFVTGTQWLLLHF